MKILVMGGTQFLGKGITEAAMATGHEVTLFNRGRTGSELFPDLEKLKGDRLASDLDSLKGRKFDAVIDPSAYIPRVIRELLDVIETDHYTLISSISVYANNAAIGQDESAGVIELDDPTVEEITGETYGGLKVVCERAAEEKMSGKVLHVRSGLIVGPFDPTDRFTYWPVRVAKGGRVLAPPAQNDAIQIIDARDEAEWIIRMLEQKVAGYFNVTGPDSLTFGDVMATTKSVSGSDAQMVWSSKAFLDEHEVAGWQDMPLWISPDGENAGFHRYNIDAAVAQGLTFRPLADTIRDTLAWHATRPNDYVLKIGISAEKEAELLEKI